MIRLSDIIRASSARAVGPLLRDSLPGFAYDSRADCRGRLFVAIGSETGDGHEYIEQAVAAGAAAVLCEYLPTKAVSVPCLLVPDVLVAMADWARAMVCAWKPCVIAVTGSLGKTTTKELIATVLGRRFRVSPSPGNLSGRLGLPIALAEMTTDAEVAVLEFASDSFGEIRAMTGMAPPNITVVTNVCEPHIDVFASLANTAAEIAAAIEALPGDGVAVLNRDDKRVWAMRHLAPAIISYGLHGGDVQAGNIRFEEGGLAFDVRVDSQQAECRTRLLAPALVYDCLAAVATGLAMHQPLAECIAGLNSALPVPGRMNPIRWSDGVIILDDTFSACPSSTLTALAGLRLFPAERRQCVLSDLDDCAGVPDWEGKLAEAVSECTDTFWALGDCAAQVAARIGSVVETRVVYSLEALSQALAQTIRPGDVVLAKGNRASRLERLIARLCGDQHGSLPLVRQEPHWETVRLVRPERPTWVEIDVEALAHNTRVLRDVCRVPIMAILKADAYGHGAARVARVALSNGADAIGVACLSEAKVLREVGITAPILVLGYTPAWQVREAVRAEVACALFGWEEAEALSRAATALGKTAYAHVKVDTGMARLGLSPVETLEFMQRLPKLKNLEVQGIFTHFGSADDADKSYAYAQLERFTQLLQGLEQAGLRPPLAHAANTAAALSMPETRLDMVRIGIGLYGLSPSPEVPLPVGIKPVLSLKTTVAQVKQVQPGTYIGYGRYHLAQQPQTIAVIPVGYADGFRRAPRNWGEVLVRGRRCPIVGSVCMDQAMIDVTLVPGVKKGDEVVLIGKQGEANIGAEEVAERLGTISYEVVSVILARVPRIT